ncbi:polyphosphate kinase 1 [Anaeromyxobacter oryzae]|uniref:Polyphosphate kinase n=1 Tax=Anaeromyxobacter oryzae TaxID=2918170 RepID=A0ABM7X249_9BACT|nr:polyphosphate kinase 1 [Anaeromyxobacter oryzae]BDG05861.1 polyphosphate kinase [Anaeromyxobacter oryzae]
MDSPDLPVVTPQPVATPSVRPAPAAPVPPVPPDEPDLSDPRLYVNRELSLLQFQWRVLDEARDPANPLLERVKFLAIVAANLDEFFMIRVAGLEQQIAAGVPEPSIDGLTPAEQLTAVRREALRLQQELARCLHEELVPPLAAAGIHLVDWPQLTEKQLAAARVWFDEMVFPVLTPLAFDPGRPFPHISNLSLNLAVLVRDGGVERFARIKVPDTLPRLVPIGRGARAEDGAAHPHAYVWLEQLVAANVDRLFPGLEIAGVHPFHVTRDAEMLIQEMEAADLLASVERGVRERRFGSVVRLVVTPGIPDAVRGLLVENLEVDPRDVYDVEAPLALSGLSALAGLDRPDLKFPAFVPAKPGRLSDQEEEEDVFAAIRRHDVLVHHPFHSFAPVVEFLRAAARDPHVLAIKQTLYRVGRNSPVVDALLRARQNGKEVAVLVELKARFDEESNIGWAKALEAEGVHVIYGLLGLKTHSKIALVVRSEGDRRALYVHLSTGNYNAVTATAYTDLGFFTADPDIGKDATQLFNYLTGYSRAATFRKLLVAPIDLREKLLALIEREIDHARAGRGGRLVFKVNALVEREMIAVLVRAARAGVDIDLLVRGVCCLRPGIPGVTDRIRVTSIVGRFLEHSRIFWFRNAGAEQVYLGSADLMHRNLARRVEVLFPVADPVLVRYLRDDVLETYLRDNVRARRMRPDGSYERLSPRPGEPAVDSQAELIARRGERRGI